MTIYGLLPLIAIASFAVMMIGMVLDGIANMPQWIEVVIGISCIVSVVSLLVFFAITIIPLLNQLGSV